MCLWLAEPGSFVICALPYLVLVLWWARGYGDEEYPASALEGKWKAADINNEL